MIHRLPLLLCSIVLLLASCGRAPENNGGTEEAHEGNLQLVQTADYLRILHNNQPVLDYRLTSGMPSDLPEHYVRTGFFHPIWSPNGQVVTDDYPVGYAHQHGLFTAWTNTTFRDSFVDFWNTHKGLAFVHHSELLETQQQEGFLGFKTRILHEEISSNKFDRSNANLVLSEDLTVRVHDRSAPFIWDIRSEQTNVSQDTLFLNKHLYGGLGIRGSKNWNKTDSNHYQNPAQFLTSEGLSGDAANHTRPDWTAIYGDLPAGKVGMAILPHPENFRAPVPVRVHPTLPYFSVSPVVEESFFIAPGATYLSRYRVIVFDGEPKPDELTKNQWAAD